MSDAIWMHDLEKRYREVSGLRNRAEYKIYYSPVRRADILLLGINPGGNPADMDPDGVRILSDPNARGAASTTYYENDEHDLLDCDWRETIVRDLLTDILGGNQAAIRTQVVKTNLAFRRSPGTDDFKALHGMTVKRGYHEAAPFLGEIFDRVCPRLVILEGSILDDFKRIVGSVNARIIDDVIETLHRGRLTDLYRAEECDLANGGRLVVVKLAHPSYHGEKYQSHKLGEKIRNLIDH